MRRWLLLLGGQLIWAAHFGLIYAISSISVQATGETGLIARVLIVGSGLLGVIAALLVFSLAWRMRTDEPIDRFWRAVSAAGAVFGATAVSWQTLPALAPI